MELSATYSLLQLSDASQCCLLLLGNVPVMMTTVSSQLIVEMLHTVSLSLRPWVALQKQTHKLYNIHEITLHIYTAHSKYIFNVMQ